MKPTKLKRIDAITINLADPLFVSNDYSIDLRLMIFVKGKKIRSRRLIVDQVMSGVAQNELCGVTASERG